MYFVFYHDGYAEDDGMGLETFDSEKAAFDYIEKRMSNCDFDPNVEAYQVIRGDIIAIEAAMMVKTVRRKRS